MAELEPLLGQGRTLIPHMMVRASRSDDMVFRAIEHENGLRNHTGFFETSLRLFAVAKRKIRLKSKLGAGLLRNCGYPDSSVYLRV